MEDAWKIICHEYMRVWKYFIPLLNKIKKKKYVLRKLKKKWFLHKNNIIGKKYAEIKKNA